MIEWNKLTTQGLYDDNDDSNIQQYRLYRLMVMWTKLFLCFFFATISSVIYNDDWKIDAFSFINFLFFFFSFCFRFQQQASEQKNHFRTYKMNWLSLTEVNLTGNSIFIRFSLRFRNCLFVCFSLKTFHIVSTDLLNLFVFFSVHSLNRLNVWWGKFFFFRIGDVFFGKWFSVLFEIFISVCLSIDWLYQPYMDKKKSIDWKLKTNIDQIHNEKKKRKKKKLLLFTHREPAHHHHHYGHHNGHLLFRSFFRIFLFCFSLS